MIDTSIGDEVKKTCYGLWLMTWWSKGVRMLVMVDDLVIKRGEKVPREPINA